MPSTKRRRAATTSTPPVMTTARYAALKRDVQQLTARAERLTDLAKVEAFWQLGERIAREKLDIQYGRRDATLRDLATDTRMAVRNLRYAVAFHHHYKRVPKLPLSWGHYRLLLDRPNDASRAHYQAIAVEQGLPVHKLARRIALDARTARGEPDSKRPTAPSYLYRAQVVKVIDGDTMDLRIDLGFHTERIDRFRLADIDCPELDSRGDARTAQDPPTHVHPGRAARDFVFTQLTHAKTIVVKTQRTDLHGRYVTHLFYSDAEVSIDQCFEQGVYLNAQLVEAGHAEVVT